MSIMFPIIITAGFFLLGLIFGYGYGVTDNNEQAYHIGFDDGWGEAVEELEKQSEE